MQANLIKKCDGIPECDNKFLPVEVMATDMQRLDQWAERVVNYTSKYNTELSVSYSPENVVGKYEKYPSYGDFPETYFLRTYGSWWKESEAYQQVYRPQEVDPLGAEDYITLGFETAVVPRDVCIYETYNPGAVVRIWGRYALQEWKLLWDGPPQTCPESARKFHPPIRPLNCLINEVRLEFNQSHLKYHTSIDAIVLGGFCPKKVIQYNVLKNDLLKWKISGVDEREQTADDDSTSPDYFSCLPIEVMVHIFQNLDLTSLSRCAQVNKTWNAASMDPTLYQNLSLKRYWHAVDANMLSNFKKRCRSLKKLDLSWCGTHTTNEKAFFNAVLGFIEECCKQLTHLSLCHCEIVNNAILCKIPCCKELTELRLRNVKVDSHAFHCLSKLTKLITLDLSTTKISDEPLNAILKANPLLKHINLDFCEHVELLDQVVETATIFNKNLITWSSFKATTLTHTGGMLFARFTKLRELDLGWCFLLTHPGDSMMIIADGCRDLKRLILSQWRGANDQMLLFVISCCKKLTQLDLLGINGITGDFCEEALRTLPDLKLLEISFCDRIQDEQVLKWRQEFPHVTIQRSCKTVVSNYFN